MNLNINEKNQQDGSKIAQLHFNEETSMDGANNKNSYENPTDIVTSEQKSLGRIILKGILVGLGILALLAAVAAVITFIPGGAELLAPLFGVIITDLTTGTAIGIVFVGGVLGIFGITIGVKLNSSLHTDAKSKNDQQRNSDKNKNEEKGLNNLHREQNAFGKGSDNNRHFSNSYKMNHSFDDVFVITDNENYGDLDDIDASELLGNNKNELGDQIITQGTEENNNINIENSIEANKVNINNNNNKDEEGKNGNVTHKNRQTINKENTSRGSVDAANPRISDDFRKRFGFGKDKLEDKDKEIITKKKEIIIKKKVDEPEESQTQNESNENENENENEKNKYGNTSYTNIKNKNDITELNRENWLYYAEEEEEEDEEEEENQNQNEIVQNNNMNERTNDVYHQNKFDVPISQDVFDEHNEHNLLNEYLGYVVGKTGVPLRYEYYLPGGDHRTVTIFGSSEKSVADLFKDKVMLDKYNDWNWKGYIPVSERNKQNIENKKEEAQNITNEEDTKKLDTKKLMEDGEEKNRQKQNKKRKEKKKRKKFKELAKANIVGFGFGEKKVKKKDMPNKKGNNEPSVSDIIQAKGGQGLENVRLYIPPHSQRKDENQRKEEDDTKENKVVISDNIEKKESNHNGWISKYEDIGMSEKEKDEKREADENENENGKKFDIISDGDKNDDNNEENKGVKKEKKEVEEKNENEKQNQNENNENNNIKSNTFEIKSKTELNKKENKYVQPPVVAHESEDPSMVFEEIGSGKLIAMPLNIIESKDPKEKEEVKNENNTKIDDDVKDVNENNVIENKINEDQNKTEGGNNNTSNNENKEHGQEQEVDDIEMISNNNVYNPFLPNYKKQLNEQKKEKDEDEKNKDEKNKMEQGQYDPNSEKSLNDFFGPINAKPIDLFNHMSFSEDKNKNEQNEQEEKNEDNKDKCNEEEKSKIGENKLQSDNKQNGSKAQNQKEDNNNIGGKIINYTESKPIDKSVSQVTKIKFTEIRLIDNTIYNPFGNSNNSIEGNNEKPSEVISTINDGENGNKEQESKKIHQAPKLKNEQDNVDVIKNSNQSSNPQEQQEQEANNKKQEKKQKKKNAKKKNALKSAQFIVGLENKFKNKKNKQNKNDEKNKDTIIQQKEESDDPNQKVSYTQLGINKVYGVKKFQPRNKTEEKENIKNEEGKTISKFSEDKKKKSLPMNKFNKFDMPINFSLNNNHIQTKQGDSVENLFKINFSEYINSDFKGYIPSKTLLNKLKLERENRGKTTEIETDREKKEELNTNESIKGISLNINNANTFSFVGMGDKDKGGNIITNELIKESNEEDKKSEAENNNNNNLTILDIKVGKEIGGSSAVDNREEIIMATAEDLNGNNPNGNKIQFSDVISSNISGAPKENTEEDVFNSTVNLKKVGVEKLDQGKGNNRVSENNHDNEKQPVNIQFSSLLCYNPFIQKQEVKNLENNDQGVGRSSLKHLSTCSAIPVFHDSGI